MRFLVGLCLFSTVFWGTCCHGRLDDSSAARRMLGNQPVTTSSNEGIGATTNTTLVDDTTSPSREYVVYTSKKDSNGYLIPDNLGNNAEDTDTKDYTLTKHVCRRLKAIHTPASDKVEVKLELGYKKETIATIDTSNINCGGGTSIINVQNSTSSTHRMYYSMQVNCNSTTQAAPDDFDGRVMEVCHSVQTYKQTQGGIQEPTGYINQGCNQILLPASTMD